MIRYVLAGMEKQNMGFFSNNEFSHVSDAVKVINNGCDVLNSKTTLDGHKLRSAYGCYLPEQDKALEVKDCVLSTRVIIRRK